MAKRDIVDHKARTHIEGVGRVSNTSAWGEQKAVDRGYCSGTRTYPPPPEQSLPQKAGDPINLQGPNYHNDVPENSWLRGGGESAQGKPNFMPGYRSSPRGDEFGTRGGPPLRVGAKRDPHR